MLRPSKSLTKLNTNLPSQVQPVMKPSSSSSHLNNLSKTQTIDKPLHVKIIKREEMESMNSSLKRSKSKQEISRINKDVTSRLYNENQIKKNYLRIIKEKAKKDKDSEVDPELTLKPVINKVSRVIAGGRNKNGLTLEDYLIEEGKKAEVKRKSVHNRRLLDEIGECSFKPQLNLISQKLAEETSKI